MKRKIFTVLFALLLSILPAIPVSAAAPPRLMDGADLLSDSEERELQKKLNEISERQRLDIVVVTLDSLEGASPVEYADDFFDYNGYGFGAGRDGILLLISMAERDWCISTSGYGIEVFTDAGQEYMSGVFRPYLSDGDYAGAFDIFAGLCDEFIGQARTGRPYDVRNLPREPFGPGKFVTALAAGFVISLIVTGMMRMQLKSVRGQTAADGYIKRGSLQLTRSSDIFLYRHVDRRVRSQESTSGRSGGSSTHRSSSGRSHGGSRGKF